MVQLGRHLFADGHVSQGTRLQAPAVLCWSFADWLSLASLRWRETHEDQQDVAISRKLNFTPIVLRGTK
jgi:hypothetical protein